LPVGKIDRREESPCGWSWLVTCWRQSLWHPRSPAAYRTKSFRRSPASERGEPLKCGGFVTDHLIDLASTENRTGCARMTSP